MLLSYCSFLLKQKNQKINAENFIGMHEKHVTRNNEEDKLKVNLPVVLFHIV